MIKYGIFIQVVLAIIMLSLSIIAVFQGHFFYLIIGMISLFTTLFGLFPVRMFSLFGVTFYINDKV
jgi:hypothetical protein